MKINKNNNIKHIAWIVLFLLSVIICSGIVLAEFDPDLAWHPLEQITQKEEAVKENLVSVDADGNGVIDNADTLDGYDSEDFVKTGDVGALSSDDGDWVEDGNGNIYRSSGNVGIGINVPVNQLHIHGASGDNTGLRITNDALTTGAFVGFDDSNNFFINSYDQSNIGIYTANTLRIAVTNDGNVGIGTLDPSDKLDVDGTVRIRNGWRGLKIQGGGTEPHRYDFIVGDLGGSVSNAGGFGIYDDTSGAYRFAISKIGNVGIGTLSPGAKLHVDGNIAVGDINTQLKKGSGDSLKIQTINGYVDIGPQNSGWLHIYTDRPKVIFDKPVYTIGNAFSSYNTGDLNLQTGGTNRITVLNSNGNVGIGTTSPGEELEIMHESPTILLRNTKTINDGSTIGNIDFYTNVDANPGTLARISADFSFPNSDQYGVLNFYVKHQNNLDKVMRIGKDATGGDGKVIIGESAAGKSANLKVYGDIDLTGTICAGSSSGNEECIGDQKLLQYNPSCVSSNRVVELGKHDFCALSLVDFRQRTCYCYVSYSGISGKSDWKLYITVAGGTGCCECAAVCHN